MAPHLDKSVIRQAIARVTKLGDFSPFGQYITFGSFMKITVGSSPSVWAPFSVIKVNL
jgi:hypothetical protein